jgi:hypothetical protein
MTIENGNITANGGTTGGAGIGTGSISQSGNAMVGLLNLSGTAALICNGTAAAAIAPSSILISNASLLFVTDGARLFGVSPSGAGDILILYRSTTNEGTELLWGLDSSFLHIGNVSVPRDDGWRFCVSEEGFGRCHGREFSGVKSLIASVPGNGSYCVLAESSTFIGSLWPSDTDSVFEVISNYSFFPTAHFVVFASVTPLPSVTPLATPDATATCSSAFTQTVVPSDSIAFTDSRFTPIYSVAFTDSHLTPIDSVAFTESRVTALHSFRVDATAPFEPSSLPFNPEVETFSFSLTISPSVTVSQSVEEFLDASGSWIRTVHHLWVTFSYHVYIPVRSFRVEINLNLEEEGKEPLSNAVIIGIVTGVAAAVAIFAGIVVFMFRHRRDQKLSDISISSAQGDQTTVLAAPEMENSSPEDPPSWGHSDDEEAIESLSNFNMNDIEDQPPIWI